MTRESENAAFMNMIIETPDDDTVRLVYADWLEEHGQPQRAEFIRLQIRLNTLDPAMSTELLARTRELLDRHEGEWVAEAGCDVLGIEGVKFRRGFIEEVHAGTPAFVHHGATWGARSPVRVIRLSSVAGCGLRLAGCPHLSRFAELEVCDPAFGTRDLRKLAISPHLRKLESLRIRGNPLEQGWGTGAARVGTDGLSGLAEAPFLGQLTRLDLRTRSRLNGRGLHFLLGCPGVSRLRSLRFDGGELGDGGAEALASRVRLGGLESLVLQANGIGDDGMHALLGSRSLRNLVEVGLSHNQVTGSGLDSLGRVALPPHLERLILTANPIDSIDVESLTRVLRARPALRIYLDQWRLPQRQRDALRTAVRDQVGL
jgi:uncharacterized protein (TIGR02996 family)